MLTFSRLIAALSCAALLVLFVPGPILAQSAAEGSAGLAELDHAGHDHAGHDHGGQALPAIEMPENNPDFDNEAESKIFEEVVDQWRETLGDMREVMILYKNGTDANDRQYHERFRELAIKGREQFDHAYESALRLVENAPRDNFEAAQFVFATVSYRFQRDWFEGTGEGCEALLRVMHNPQLLEIAGVSFYATNQFDKAERYLNEALEAGVLTDENRVYLAMLDEAREQWTAEQRLREQDAQQADLPRVRFRTTRGDIVVELFEDQVPNTVANFIRLVEDGEYENAPFYQVISRRIAMAGDRHGDRAGRVGFTIRDEAPDGEGRGMFRGSLAMAKLPHPTSTEQLSTLADTASSHFFAAYVPLPAVNREHTVFGRIVEGMPAFSALTRIDPSAEKAEDEPVALPDRILSAEVIRKRESPYEPERHEQSPVDAAMSAVAPEADEP